MCVNFTDLNKACPKDSFPLPRIDQLVNATAEHETLSFMDAYSGYNHIRMHKPDEEKTAFTTDQGLYYYTVMPFGLKNAGATYQRLVNKRYGMKLNPAKCEFGVPSGRFLGYQVHQRGIEVNPEKIQALAKMVSPKTLKDVQRLTGCLASLSSHQFCAGKTGEEGPETNILHQQGIVIGGDQVLASRKNGARSNNNKVSGRLTKWAIELSEFDIEYLPRTAIKAQAVADFVAEFTEPSMEVVRMMVEQNKKVFKWQLRVDGSSNTHGRGAGVVVSTPEGDSVECALRFDFKSTNNQAEYKALIAGLKVCTVLGVDEVEIFSDSQVVVNQVLDEYQARDESMIAYLELAKELLERFKEYRIVQGYSRALQRCVGPEEAEGILRSIHGGNCGNHTGGVSLAHKTLRQGFYWPTLFADAKRMAARCEPCQKISNNIRQPPELLQSITSPWPFAMWGIDLIGPMPTTVGGAKHAIKNILYRFGIPNTIITDNGTQFDGRKFRELCDKYDINNYYASPAHPQTNNQTEAVNKIIKHNLKAKLAVKKGNWVDKLPQVLWAYRTTERGSTGETPYSMAYGAEAVIPVETSFSSPRVQLFQPELNIDMLKCGLDELEERREHAQIRNTAYQQRIARYYNSHVRERRFVLGDLVLKRVNPGTRDKAAGSLAEK
ncbi:hypothetical protein Q3G72_002138 [Acer saccharum]|nr:hypothetical protein Q3G72_002138 [Acer saccharum]